MYKRQQYLFGNPWYNIPYTQQQSWLDLILPYNQRPDPKFHLASMDKDVYKRQVEGCMVEETTCCSNSTFLFCNLKSCKWHLEGFSTTEGRDVYKRQAWNQPCTKEHTKE